MTRKPIWIAVPVYVDGIVGHNQQQALALETVQKRRVHFGKQYIAGLTTAKGRALTDYRGAKVVKP